MTGQVRDVDDAILAYREMLAHLTWLQRAALWAFNAACDVVAEVCYQAEQGVSWLVDRRASRRRRSVSYWRGWWRKMARAEG